MAAIAKIEIETRKLQSDVDRLSVCLSDLRTTGKEMMASIQALSATWEGEAKDAFAVQFQKDYETLTAMENLLGELIRDLQYAREQYDACESGVGSIISAIKV